MRRKTIIFIIAAGAFALAGAQENFNEVFAPFVSRVSAVAEATRIVLTWKNSEDLSGYKQIFRSRSEITELTLKDAVMIARVAPDIESYIDTPQSTEAFFYAVLLEDKSGELYKVFIPFRNKTSSGVKLAAVKTEAGEAAAVTGILAEAVGDTVTVRFTPSNRARELILYRSIYPIRSYADLTKATYSILLSPGTDRVKDVPVAGIDYYYAVFDAGLLNAGKAVFSAGANITAFPIQIPLQGGVARTEGPRARTYPLPAPHILYSVETGEELLPPLPFLLPPEMKLKDAAAGRADALIARIRRAPKDLAFEILPYDEALQLEGEDQTLQALVQVSLKEGDPKGSIDRLNDFLSTHHSDQVEARGRFYLGQSYYLHGQFREALIEFIFAESYYYMESQKWLDACLEKLGAVR